MSETVKQWLQDLGLGQYAAAFAANDIDRELLPDLDQQTLKDIGVDSAGHRLRILRASQALQAEPDPAESVAVDPDAQDEKDLAGWARTPGELKPVTMLFADIVGSTALTEKLDPEEAHDLLYRATQLMCEAVESNRGTVCRFMGDGIMAMFGAPLASERHALEACRAALDMLQDTNHYASQFEAAHGVGLKIRVGLNSGEVVVLEVGDDPKNPEFDASGSTVPLAARMEQAAAPGTILMTESTRALADQHIETDESDSIRVKGVSETVVCHRLKQLRSQGASVANLQPFVGRGAELAQFGGLLQSCADSCHGQTIYLRGEAGIGKTRLVEEMSEHASAAGYEIHKALVLDFGAGKGQGAVPSIVRSMLGISQGSGKSAREAALRHATHNSLVRSEYRVFWNDMLDLKQPLDLKTLYDAMDAGARKQGKREALAELISAKAGLKPLLLIIEDLHWADDITLSYLASLASTITDCRALLVCTSRIEGDPIDIGWRASTGDAPIVTWDISPLRREEAIRFVSAFIDAEDRLAQRCMERAAGNPLFLKQLLLSLDKGTAESVPDSIKSLVLARMDQLSSIDKQALQVASVLGQRFDPESLRELIGQPDYDFAELVTRHLIRAEGTLYLFAHALIQEGAYTSLLKKQRTGIHRRAADWYSDRDAVLYAEHLDHAEDENAAEAYLEAAAEQARLYRPERALQLVKRGLDFISSRAQFRLYCLEGDLLRTLGRVDESIAAYENARNLAVDEVELCHALVGIIEGLNVGEAHDRMLEVLDEAGRLAREHQLWPELTVVSQYQSSTEFFQGNYEACVNLANLALECAMKTDSVEIKARAMSSLADAEYCRGRFLSAFRLFDECIELARAHGLGRVIAANLTMRGLTLRWKNDVAAAQRDFEEAIDLAIKTRHLRAEMIACYASKFWAELGDFELAERMARRGIEIGQQLGSALLEATNRYNLGRIIFQGRDDRETACDYLRQGIDLLRNAESGMTFRGPTALGMLAMVTVDAEERKAALAEAESLMSVGCMAHNQLDFYEDAIEACLQAEQWSEVDRYARALEDFTAAEPMPRSDFFIARGHALAAFGRGSRGQELQQQLRRIHDEADSMGACTLLPALEQALHQFS